MRLVSLIALGGLMLAGGVSADIVGDRANGKKISGQCRTCHGADGYARIPIAPHIGGEPESYLRAQLAAFRDGTRTHEMMTIVARGLTDQQIADLAAWYGGHTVTIATNPNSADAPAQCVDCHGVDGVHMVDDAPNLAGETNIYIDTQLKAFRTGKREHAVMSPIAQGLSDSEIRAIADYYAGIKMEIELVE